MNTVELMQYSLGFAFDMLGQLVSDLTQEQADWQPPGNANPIGALYWHIVSYVDQLTHAWAIGQEPLKQRAGWQEKVVIALPPADPEDPMGTLRAIRVGVSIDLPALHEYARATADTLQEWLTSLTPEDLERTIETTIGELSLAQMLEAYVIWHINVHCGEISAIKGCQGLTGYPW
jgi:hypothetical protein